MEKSSAVKGKLLYIRPFLVSAIQIIRKMTGISVAKKRIYVVRGKKSVGGVGVILDIKGDIAGKVVYEFSRHMTMRISNRMLKESQIVTASKEEFKALLEAAILELGNIISGHALGGLQQAGFNCDISTPRFYLGKDVDLIPFYFTSFVLEFTSEYGDFSINLSLTEKRDSF